MMPQATHVPTRSQMEEVLVLYSAGELDTARRAAAKLVEEFPQIAMLHNILGAINARQGNQTEAVTHFSSAIKSNPNFSDAYNNLAVALKSLGRHEEAVENYKKAIAIKPDYAEAYYNLANTLRDLERREEAVVNYLQALLIAPNHHGARNNLGVVLNKLERYDEAIMHFEMVVKANPRFVDAYNNLGLSYKSLGREEEALASFAKAIEMKPDYAEAHFNLGNYLFDLGRKEDAVSSYEAALSAKPDFAEVYRSMTAAKLYQEGDPQVTHMQTMLVRDEVSDKDRMHLYFALGKISEGFEKHEDAFDYYSKGNLLRKKFLGYSPDVERKMFQKVKTSFEDAGPSRALKTEYYERLRHTPIFIVGMPRSGTSLTEHILASHSKIYGAGELMTLGKAVNSFWVGSPFDTGLLEKIREKYLSDMYLRGANEPYITDKMHLNYRWIGFICLAFPDAKIVHIKRRSIASCWSIFKHYFSDLGNGYACDLEDVAEYYSSYMDLMKFWEERFPGAIYNLSYERLTEDQEAETRKLLAYLDLDFEQSCIDFHETRRAVATISSIQVRRKLYKGSSEEWRKYEKFLGPLVDRLGTE